MRIAGIKNTLSYRPFSGIVCGYVYVVCYAGLSVDPAHCGLFKRKKEKIVKTRIGIAMLVLGCLVVMSVYAAEEGAKETATATASTPTVVTAAKKSVSLETEMEKVSYIIGTQIARNFKTQDIEVNIDSLAQGIKDALAGGKLAISEAEMNTVYTAWQQKMKAKQAAKQAKAASEGLAKGKAYLEANRTKEGVIVLPSGLQYKVIKEGTGNTPVATDKVKTHDRGTLIDGTEFDSSYKRGKPAEFPVTGVIKGWIEALQLMKEGGKWELYIPADLAYGSRARPGMPANSTLIFEIELIEIVKPAEPAEAAKPVGTVK
jgi:FKBP-type peptidyl-prolyl cis-trans isomerase